ncbi:MAG: molybdate ABC transporter substrate-binding protein, partial [Rhodospirillales bacterium]
AAVPALAQDGGVVVFAAASMKNALDDAAKTWQAQGKATRISYAASSALARQIEAGAPADVFISADTDWMNYLAERKLIRADTRRDLLANRIVLIAPKSSTVATKIAPGFPLASLLGGGKLAMAQTETVPAGKYGKASLTALGVWPSVERSVAQAENVRAALLLVSRAEAPLGIVYQTDAAADANVRIVDAFPADTHPPIVYPVAVLAGAKHADAAAFVTFLRSDAAKPAFVKQGFTVLD